MPPSALSKEAAMAEIKFKPGDLVVILDGEYAGYIGEILDAREGLETVGVRVRMGALRALPGRLRPLKIGFDKVKAL
jgi:transcription antitermination factor NusG